MTAHLLLIDGLNLVRPIYETNPSTNPEEKLEGVLTTVNRSFIRALERHKPTHLAWVFESRGQTWRHDLYPDYKSSRPAPPPLLLEVVSQFKVQLASQGVVTLEYPNVEADDAIGCIAGRACNAGIPVTVLSTDKDLAWLLTLGAKVYNHFASTYRDLEWCRTKLGIEPHQIPDYLALLGDTVDDIPGVDKVGHKTAGQLLAKYNGLEAILAAAVGGEVKGVVGKNLVAQAELARLSRKLTGLNMDAVTGALSLSDFKVKAAA